MNNSHIKQMDVIINLCLAEISKNPIEIIRKMMALPLCRIHGPEHHIPLNSML